MAAQQPAPTTRTSAPYGQACVGCAKAKCKCILTSQASPGTGRSVKPTCERCARLGRECKPSSSVRSRGAAAGSRHAVGGSAPARGSRGVPAANRAADIEQRLAILEARVITTTTHASSLHDDRESRQRAGADRNVRTQQHETTTASGIVSGGPTVVTPASTAYAPCSTPGSTPGPLPTPEAEETLAFFRRHHIKFFPFVYLPPDMTAAQLQQDRPYLWLNISAICCRSPAKQAALSRQCREELAHKILVNCERNIDTLLGTLCFLGWTMHLCFKPSMAAIMGMAMSVVSDLRLDKPSQEEDPRLTNCFKSADFVRTPPSSVRTMEERRAALGCYVFCSSGTAFLKCCSSMRWTSHMEDSLKILAANPEWEGDQILVLMVRIRRFADSIGQAQATGVSDYDNHGTVKPPANIYIKYFRHRLQIMKDELPVSLRDNRLATSLILSAELMISEIPFCGAVSWTYYGPEWHMDDSSARHQPGTQQPPQVPRPVAADMSRIEANYTTLQTSKAFFEHFLTFELSDLVGFSFTVLLNFFRAAQVLYRLRVMDEPGWDGSAIMTASGTDLLAPLHNMADNYARIPELYGFLTDTDVEGNEVANFYTKCAKTFSGTLQMWRAQFAQAEASRDGVAVGAGVGVGVGVDTGTRSQVPLPTMIGGPNATNVAGRVNGHSWMNNFMLPELFPMDFSIDDAWYNEMLSSWDPNVFGSIQ